LIQAKRTAAVNHPSSISLSRLIGVAGGMTPPAIRSRAATMDAAVARRYAGNVRVIAVKTFPQALRALATLPLKR